MIVVYCWGPGSNGAVRAVREIAAIGLPVKEMIWHTQAFNAPARPLYDTVAQLTSYVHDERDIKEAATPDGAGSPESAPDT